MIAEIVGNGRPTLPNAMGVCLGSIPETCSIKFKIAPLAAGIVPSLALTIYLGVFALYTTKPFVDFKLNHPAAHNMAQSFPCSDHVPKNPRTSEPIW